MGRSYASRRRVCPRCGVPRGVPILYGMPSPELYDKMEREEIVAGGCVVAPGAPEWACTACGHRWRERQGSSL